MCSCLGHNEKLGVRNFSSNGFLEVVKHPQSPFGPKTNIGDDNQQREHNVNIGHSNYKTEPELLYGQRAYELNAIDKPLESHDESSISNTATNPLPDKNSVDQSISYNDQNAGEDQTNSLAALSAPLSTALNSNAPIRGLLSVPTKEIVELGSRAVLECISGARVDNRSIKWSREGGRSETLDIASTYAMYICEFEFSQQIYHGVHDI